MRLESAMFTSREGLVSNGQAISVVGDNIANSNTTAFKSSRPVFTDLVAEGLEGRASETVVAGRGTHIAEIQQVQEAGLVEQTGRSLDCGIVGDGFFIIKGSDQNYFTRAGDFSMRSDGTLVTSDDKAVLGFQGTKKTGDLTSLNLLNIDLSGQPTSKITVYGNVNSAVEAGTPPSNPQSFKEIAAAASAVTSLEVYDSLGASHAITVAYTKTGAGTWTAQAYIDGGDVGGTEGVPVQLGSNLNLAFGTDGTIPAASKASAVITCTPAYSDGAAAGNFVIDMSNYTQFAAPSQLTSNAKDGQSSGQIKNYEIHENGEVYAMLDSGSTALVGTIPLANFSNPDGLERVGHNLYYAGQQSGEQTVGVPGEGTYGKLQGASLERSTVDVADEFVNLVLYQRGYQANSQVLNTTNGMLKDTISLMR